MNLDETLRRMADAVTNVPHEHQCGVLRGLEAALNLLNARAALPHTARWFLETRTVEDKQPDEADDFWASRVSREAAEELRELVPRFVVLYGESRKCDLVGNSGAEWGYSALALLPGPPDDALQKRLLQELFDEVAGLDGPYKSSPSQICNQALGRIPSKALLRIHYEYENPNVVQGHCMMRLAFEDSVLIFPDEVVSYWPALDDSEYNFVDLDVLSDTCESLGLRRVLPMQLATFLTVLANATADHTESWGGKSGAFFFDEGNIPYVLKQLAENSSDKPQSPASDSSDEVPSGKRRIPLLVPPKKEIGKHGLPIAVYVDKDGEIRVWWAANRREAKDIERFCKAAESFDPDDPSTHTIEF